MTLMTTKPELPNDLEPISEIIDRTKRAYARRAKRRAAEMWLPIHIPEHQGLPFGVAFVGDMHIDNPGADLAMLQSDLFTIANTPGLYGIFMGDGTDNWVGRLMSLYHKHSMTKLDGLRLFRWAMFDSGVNWLAGLMGNHDLWNDGATVLDLMNNGEMYLPRWEARLDLRCGGQSWKVHAAHNFKGSSTWNPTHGPLKAAMTTTPAELLVAAHLHTGGIQSFEMPGFDKLVHVARARGYKFDDDYAMQAGFAEHKHGATVLAVFDPQAKTPAQRIQLFYDLDMGAEYLSAIRAHRSRVNAPKKARAKPAKGFGGELITRAKKPAKRAPTRRPAAKPRKATKPRTKRKKAA